MLAFSDFDSIAERGIAVTAVDDDKAMACGGVTFLNDKEGIVWVKVSRDCTNRPVMWARTIKETFGLMIDSVKDMRISTWVLDGFCRGEKLARFIKMKRSDETVRYNNNIYNKYTVVL